MTGDRAALAIAEMIDDLDDDTLLQVYNLIFSESLTEFDDSDNDDWTTEEDNDDEPDAIL